MAILRHAPLLRQFLAVVREGSLSGAAHALALTQPALTKSIQRLETELGVKLFERLPPGAPVSLAASTDALHLFDAASGQRIGAGDPYR